MEAGPGPASRSAHRPRVRGRSGPATPGTGSRARSDAADGARARSRAGDRDAPQPLGADLVLVVALLTVLTGLAWGVIWVQNAATATQGVPAWQGAVPPAAAALGAAFLLGVRRAYAPLPRLRCFLTRMAALGVAGAAALAIGAALVLLR